MIDVNFDFRSEIREGTDPDLHSPTLRNYHQILWSKKLPNGQFFKVEKTGKYLSHNSSLGNFVLSSDGVLRSFIHVKAMSHITRQLEDQEKCLILSKLCTICGFLVFPSNRILGSQTINQRRGCDQRIVDRLDLTLECIRRFYIGQESPLTKTINAYSEFFRLFGNFKKYVSFFLLQDLVSEDFTKINFHMSFDDSFPLRPFPQNLDAYRKYIIRLLQFADRRTERIRQYSLSLM